MHIIRMNPHFSQRDQERFCRGIGIEISSRMVIQINILLERRIDSGITNRIPNSSQLLTNLFHSGLFNSSSSTQTLKQTIDLPSSLMLSD